MQKRLVMTPAFHFACHRLGSFQTQHSQILRESDNCCCSPQNPEDNSNTALMSPRGRCSKLSLGKAGITISLDKNKIETGDEDRCYQSM